MAIYVSHLFEDDEFSKIIEEYSCGIESIEFSIGSSLDQVMKSVNDYKNRLGQSLSKRAISLHGPFLDLCPCSFDPAIRQVTMLRYNQCYEAAKQLGATRIIFHTCYYKTIYYASIWRENSVKFFQEFLADKDDSIAIHIENVFEEEYTDLLELVKAVNHKAFSICLDVGHVHCFSKKSIEEWIGECQSYIGHIHLHNNGGQRDEHIALDQGTIPMNEIMNLIEELCPKVDYTLEMNTPEDARKSLAWLEERKRDRN